MLRFDVALEALKRRMAPKPKKERPAEAESRGVLIPFPLRRLEPVQARKRGASA